MHLTKVSAAALVVFTLSVVSAPLTHAAVPSTFTYQGSLKQSGALVNGNYSMEFRITNVDGLQLYWTSGVQTVAIKDSLYRVELAPANVDWANITPYIEVKVSGNTLLPREKMSSAPFAFMAKDLGAGACAKGNLTVNGQTLLSTGTAAAPGLAFGNDPDSGALSNNSVTSGEVQMISNGKVAYRYNTTDHAWYVGGATVANLDSAAFAPASNAPLSLGKTTFPFKRIVLSTGSADAPALAFGGDDLTGIYRTGDTQNVSISANGHRRAIFSEAKNQIFNGLEIAFGDLTPNSTGVQDLGNSVDYWGAINYKSLVDRGCLGWFDEGVLMQDGKIYSDMDALSMIKKDPVKTTFYGVEMLDYRTFPAVAYKKATFNVMNPDGTVKETRAWPRDTNDRPYDPSGLKKPEDGVEMTSMQSIMIGAFKEANARIKALETQVTTLQAQVLKLQGK